MKSYFKILKSLGTMFLMLGTLNFTYCQDVGKVRQKITVKEWNFELFANTSGFGGGYQHGRTPDDFNKYFWEIDFLYNQHPKAIRSINTYYSGVKPYRYGQLYTLFFLRGGYGYQRILNHRPYWGGVQVRYTLSGGADLGIGIPNYVEVLNYNTGFAEIVRYDPLSDNLNNIIGGASLFNGILQTIIRPGFYAKTGLNFDFANSDYRIQSLEIGVTIDMVFPFIQQMANNPAKKFYLAAYLSYNFGRKKGNYE